MLHAMVGTTSKRKLPSSHPGQDGRRLSRAQLVKLRTTAVRRVLAGKRQSDVLRKLGLSRTWLARQLELHKSSGQAALDRPARGSRPSQLTQQRVLGLLRAAIRQDLQRKSRTTPLGSCATLATRLQLVLP